MFCALIRHIKFVKGPTKALGFMNVMKCAFVGFTYSMEQSPSSEANWFAASQEILRISQNLKVHYHTHKR